MGSDTKRMFLAVILSGIVLFGWQIYFGQNQEPLNTNDQTVDLSVKSVMTETEATKEEMPVARTNPIVEEVYSAIVNEHAFTFTNKLSIREVKNPNAVFDFASILGEDSSFALEVNDSGSYREVLFNISYDESKNVYTGKNEQLGLQLVITPTEEGKLKFQILSLKPYKYKIVLKTSKKELENRQMRQYIWFTADMDYDQVGDESQVDGTLKWFGVDFNYHLFAVVFKDKQPALLSMTEGGQLTAEINQPVNNFEYYILFSKKNYDFLATLGDNLKQSVDFGVFSILAVPILRGLQFIYKYIPNYGIGIILLTLLIRLLTFPLQYKSFKSMKKMQEVQPELAKLKEKFKDDPQRMQKETMDLFKRAGANPLGGCLPLLLQLPFFFAIYKVLYSSVELVGAPFFGWIHDLSNKDPYYVLPVLMAVSMFLQQKITPTATADPTQQKVMMFMPLIFGLIMKDLPSGLVLYIFVSTIFGIAQQFFVYKVTD